MDGQVIQDKGLFSRLEKLSFSVLLLMVFFIPLFFIPGGYFSVQFGSSLLFAFGVILSLLLFIIIRLRRGFIEIPKSKLNFLGLFLAVPVVYIISSLANGVSRMAFLGYTFDVTTVGFITLSFVFIYLISVIFNTKNRIFYSFLAIVLTSIIFALFLILRMVFGPAFLSFGLFSSLTNTVMSSWNSAGIFFGICLILSLTTEEMVKLTRFMKIVVTVAILISLSFLAIINFRSIWIIVGLVSLLFMAYKIFSPDFYSSPSNIEDSWNESVKKIFSYSLIVFVISLVFIFWGNTIGSKINNALHISNFDVRPSLSVTYDLAKASLHNKPIFGSGPNTFLLQWLSNKPADINSTIFWNTDFSYGVGLLPTFIVTTGIVGTLSWLLFFTLYIYLGFKYLFWKDADLFSKYLGISSFFISLYLWVMNIIYIPGVVIFVLTLFFSGLFLAHLYNSAFLEKKNIVFSSNPKIGFISSLVLVALFVASTYLSYSLYNNFSSLWYFQKALYAGNVSKNLDDSEKYLEKAESLVPYDVYYRTQVDVNIAKINKLFSEDLSKMDKSVIQKTFSDSLSKAISAGLNARAVDPDNYLNWISLGQAYEVASSPQVNISGAYDSANVAYSEALKRNPQNPAINLLFARLENERNNFSKAKDYTLAAIKQKPNYLDAYFLLSQLEVANKNLKGAIDSVSVATLIDPSNPNIYFQLGLLKYNDTDYPGAIIALNKSIELAPDYANAKYFLGLSLVKMGDNDLAIKQFQDLQKTNPDNAEVKFVLTNLLSGKSPFADAKPPINSKPETAKELPVTENNQ